MAFNALTQVPCVIKLVGGVMKQGNAHAMPVLNTAYTHPGRLRGASARRHRCRAAHWLGGRPHARALITTPHIHTIAVPTPLH